LYFLCTMNVVITGASRGLGRAIAEKFAKEGHQLFLSSRTQSLLEQTASEIKKNWPSAKVKFHAVDISKKEEAIALGDWILQQQIALDVLVNNAGSFISGSVYNEPDEALEKMIATNLYSAYHLTRKVLPAMMQKKRGHIFNVCSIASLKAYENGGAYSISKFALLGFNRNLREEMKPYNIKVTAILPGATFTDSWAASGVSADRIMEASDIAELVYSATHLSPQACVEEIIVRPQLGDL
jgi:short-subunit dehydrogenase